MYISFSACILLAQTGKVTNGDYIMKFNLIDIGKRIVKVREEKHLSQFDLAEEMGLSTSQLSKIEKGYGCDAVAEALSAEGITDYMVEIGGEVVTSWAHIRRT